MTCPESVYNGAFRRLYVTVKGRWYDFNPPPHGVSVTTAAARISSYQDPVSLLLDCLVLSPTLSLILFPFAACVRFHKPKCITNSVAVATVISQDRVPYYGPCDNHPATNPKMRHVHLLCA